MHSKEALVSKDSQYFVYIPSATAARVYLYPQITGFFTYEPGYYINRKHYDNYLLMYIAGADRADIVADYSLTYAYITDYIEKNRETLWSPDSVMHYSTPQTMNSLISYIDEAYGSIGNYLAEIGVTDEALAGIKRRMLADS